MDSLLINLQRSMRNAEIEMLVWDGTPLEIALHLAGEAKARRRWSDKVGVEDILPRKYLRR